MTNIVPSLSRSLEVIKSFFTKELLSVIGLVLKVKVLLWLFSFVGLPIVTGELELLNPMHWSMNVWHRWDALWYVRIAEIGYPGTGDQVFLIAFLPLYPITIALFSKIFGNLVISAQIAGNVFSLLGLVAFYILAKFEFGVRMAWYALLTLLVFPSAYFFNAGYTEGLYLLLGVLAFYFSRRGWWASACVLALLVTATKTLGVVIIPALIIEFLLQRREKKVKWSQALWLLITPLGFLFYLYINYLVFGEALAFMDIVSNEWNKYLAWPWIGFMENLGYLKNFSFNSYTLNNGLFEVVAVIFFVIMGVLSLFKLRLSYAVFIILTGLIVISTNVQGSTPRYILSAFPIFFLLGAMSRWKAIYALWLGFSLMLMLLILTMYLMWFGGY